MAKYSDPSPITYQIAFGSFLESPLSHHRLIWQRAPSEGASKSSARPEKPPAMSPSTSQESPVNILDRNPKFWMATSEKLWDQEICADNLP